MAPDVFSFFRREQRPGAEPLASRVDQASTAETTGPLELEVFDPGTTFYEPATIEIDRLQERATGVDVRGERLTAAGLEQCASGALPQPEGGLAAFSGQTDRVAAGLADANRLAAVVSDVETRLATLEARGHSLIDTADRLAPALGEADRLATVVSSVETRIATLLEREHGLPETAARIAAGLAEADRIAAIVSCVEARVATLEARERSLTHAADRLAPGLAEANRLADVVSCLETRVATLDAREHALNHATDRIAPGLAEAGRLATVVSGVERRIATLLDREQFLAQTAAKIAAGLAEADRLATVVSGVETRVAALREREHSLTRTAEKIAAGLAAVDRLAEVLSRVKTRIAALFARKRPVLRRVQSSPEQSLQSHAVASSTPPSPCPVDAGRSTDDGPRRGESTRTIRRLAFIIGVLGSLAFVAVGGGPVLRWARPPAADAVTPRMAEAPIAAAAAAGVLPSPAVDEPILPAPISLATAATPVPVPADSAPRRALSSRLTRQRARAARPAADSTAPTVFAGTLAIQSNPAGGTVFLDRRRVGETPLRLTGVTAGAHVIWIESEGYARWTASVQVNTGKLVSVRATLEPRR